MKREMAGLFDLDGVILDTEGLYSRFWTEQGQTAHPEIPDFSNRIKGRTLRDIFECYFPDPELQREIVKRISDFESRMPFDFIPGAAEFVAALKKQGVGLAIVTSSDNKKMSYVYRAHPELKEMFDVIITADKITRSKPDPECYLLAAEELGIQPSQCFVFEDSFSGLEAGRRAGMTVIGLTTTNPAEAIREKADVVLPDFRAFSYEKLIAVGRHEPDAVM